MRDPLPVDVLTPPKRMHDLVEAARRAWEARYKARSKRRRARDFFAGEQWETYTDPVTGEQIDEKAHIEAQGRIPWAMNEIRPIVQNLRGQFRQNYSHPLPVARQNNAQSAEEQMSVALEVVHDQSEVSEIDADEFLECVLAGAFGWKITAKWNSVDHRDEVRIDPVDQNRIFFNPDLCDRRAKDIDFIGEIHDWTLDEIIQQFATTEAEEAQLRQIYSEIAPVHADRFTQAFEGFEKADSLNFFWPSDPSKARVVEVWAKKYSWVRYAHDPLDGLYEPTTLSDAEVAEINQARVREAQLLGLPEAAIIEVDQEYESIWCCYFMTPEGHVLWEGETPYWHGEHPYTIGFPVLLDGEHWGIVEDIIDPQRLMNRMTSSIDFMFGIGARGLLMVPEDSIPDDMDIDDFAQEWTRMGGVIKFRAKPGAAMPQQITTNAIPAGIFTWLAHQREWMEKISGVNQAVQGLEPNSGTPATLYAAQIQQGQVGNLDFFQSFYVQRRERDRKALQVILQFYDQRPLHSARNRTSVTFTPEIVRQAEYDIVIQDVQDTATTRQLWEADLKEHLTAARLTFRQYLQMSAHPKADALMQIISQTNPLLLGQPVAPEMVEAAQAGNPDAMALITQAQEQPAAVLPSAAAPQAAQNTQNAA